MEFISPLENIYDLNFEVKYASIEKDLKEKIKNGENQYKNDENEYSEQDVEDICFNLYNHEFLKIFYCDQFTGGIINERMENLWCKMDKDVLLLELMEKIRNSVYCGTYVDKFMLFCCLFSYDSLHLFHKYIKESFSVNSEDIRKDLIREIETAMKL